ncbi:MAG: class I SAM-dependent methyltransferase [Candidatus Heimdallarchaeota archaeon]|nr:class I SAM-dependent methyltransferase [Candidatus Heimdallarchaeota archaeon]MDH5646000.1 class I SAM-dependent methyltransferase [Candidatus Heimdallarchaeota archaeon]
MGDRHKNDKKIGKTFNRFFNKEPKDAILENFDASSQLHVEHILAIKPNSVLDVGMGAGGILLALQKQGVPNLSGVDLSPNAVQLTKKRFEKFGTLENTSLIEGNFLDMEYNNFDAISFHHILNLYPDYKSLITKAIELNPKVMAISMPQNLFKNRIKACFLSILVKILSFDFPFRLIHNHRPEDVVQLFTATGYTQSFKQLFKKNLTMIFIKSD